MNLVPWSHTEDFSNVVLNALLIVLGVLPDLLDLDPLLLGQVVRVLEPHEGYNGYFLKGLGRVLERYLYP